MNVDETGQLLAALAHVDNREVDSGRAAGWYLVLDDIPFEVGLIALRAALKVTPRIYIDAQVVREYAQPVMRRIARDVKSARVRGWVPKEWPDTKPLPPAVSQRLADEFAATNDSPDDITALGTGKPADIGEIGRGLPE